MRLYLIRHGETPWNVVKRLQGRSDIALNENGRALAKVTARALRNVPFDIVISSPLSRSIETAEIVTSEREIPFLTDERIQEISFGVLEGELFKTQEGKILFSEFEKFFHHPETYIPPKDGETIEELLARVSDFLHELSENETYQDKTILVSSHGAASRAILASIRHSEIKDFWGPGVPRNCAVSIIDFENGKWNILEQDILYYENV